MNIVFHDQEFDKKMLEKFVDAVNSPDEIVNIFLYSEGGHVSVMEVMINIINQYPERFRLVGYSDLCSCAFEMYMRVKCQKSLVPGTIGMYHQTLSDITMNDRMKPVYAIDKANMHKKKNHFLPTTVEFMNQCEFTDKEKKRVKKGHDVYFQYDRFKEIENAYTKNTQL